MPFDGNTTAPTLQQFWDASLARGLFPLAIARGSKAPLGGDGWSTWSQPIAHPGAAGIGWRCRDGGLSAFDVDKNDKPTADALLAAFRAVLGPNIPVRRRTGSPRFLVPYVLTDEPVAGRSFRFPDGDGFQLIGGQFVAYGPHKDGGEYYWEHLDNDFPRLTTAQLQEVLARVPAMAGTSLSFGAQHETASLEELEDAKPRNDAERAAGRQAAERFLGSLTHELRGKFDQRGSSIFAHVGTLKFAVQQGLCTREEIENAITNAGQHLDSKNGGRTLMEEIDRQDEFPVLRGNAVMSAIVSARSLHQGAIDAAVAPSMALLTGYELKPPSGKPLPWIIHQRILRAEVHFFTGHAGAGKSAVVSDLSKCLLSGAPWLDADIETRDGHVLWVAAEDDYGTERRMNHLLMTEPNYDELRHRFHLIPSMPDPLAFESQCIAQCASMAAMGKRVDIVVLDTWSASGLCFDDNKTETVAKTMHSLKQIAQRSNVAVIVPDHLPLGNEDAWQKGNGAKSGNAGFVYRVTVQGNNVSIDCGKARGAPKARSYTGRIASHFFDKDEKGRDTTVNVFEREIMTPEKREQSTALKLAALLPGAQEGMGALQGGALVKFDSVAAETSEYLMRQDRVNPPDYIATVDGARALFGPDLQLLIDRALAFKMKPPYIGVRTPIGMSKASISLAGFGSIAAPANKMPWE